MQQTVGDCLDDDRATQSWPRPQRASAGVVDALLPWGLDAALAEDLQGHVLGQLDALGDRGDAWRRPLDHRGGGVRCASEPSARSAPRAPRSSAMSFARQRS